MKLLKDPVKAERELRRFQVELQALQTRYYFSEMHSLDVDSGDTMMDTLHKVEKISYILLDKITEINKPAADSGCKIKELSHA